MSHTAFKHGTLPTSTENQAIWISKYWACWCTKSSKFVGKCKQTADMLILTNSFKNCYLLDNPDSRHILIGLKKFYCIWYGFFWLDLAAILNQWTQNMTQIFKRSCNALLLLFLVFWVIRRVLNYVFESSNEVIWGWC